MPCISQGKSPPPGIDFSNAIIDPSTGQRCIVKTEEIETTTRDPILTCTHKSVTKCSYTYKTSFKPHQQNKCREHFQKACRISFKKQATDEIVRKCYRPVEKQCNGKGKEECHTIQESFCKTKYVKKEKGKYVGETSCAPKPIQLCGAGCEFKEGEEECHDKKVTKVHKIPEEVCDLKPRKICSVVTKLVPHLEPVQVCRVIPRQVCSLQKSPAKPIRKPLLTKWCLEEEVATLPSLEPPIDDIQEAERSNVGISDSSNVINSIDDNGEGLEHGRKSNAEKSVIELLDQDEKTIDGRGFKVAKVQTEIELLDEVSNNINRNSFQVEDVQTNVEGKFPTKRIKIPTSKFVEDSEIDDIDNPFTNIDDLESIVTTHLTSEERVDLENFNIGLQLQKLRINRNKVDERNTI